METRLDSLEVFCGELTPNRAVIVARLAGGDEIAELSVAGNVRGPRCSRGSTLPATYHLVGQVSNLSKSKTRQVENLSYAGAMALVTEPIFWSPDWPALYDVTVELRQGSKIIEQATRTIGLRPIAVVGKNLAYGGKTWVLRGVRCDRPTENVLRECREQALALFSPAEALDERLLTEASETGVLVLAQLESTNVADELSRLNRFAAVAMAVLPRGHEPYRSAAPGNILLAHQAVQGQAEPSADDARSIVGEVFDDRTFGSWASGLVRPVIAYRPVPEGNIESAARRECDRLQRELAPYGQFAGYIV